MARIFSSGFELNSLTAGVEWTTILSTPTIQTATVRSGTYAGKVSNLVTLTPQGWTYQFSAADTSIDIRVRFYFYIQTMPASDNLIFRFLSSTNNDSLDLNLSHSKQKSRTKFYFGTHILYPYGISVNDNC